VLYYVSGEYSHCNHAVVVIDEINDRLFVVTVHEPSPEEWEDDWRTRKK